MSGRACGTILCCAVCLSVAAVGDNVIYGSPPSDPNNPSYLIRQIPMTVTIVAPGTYRFWAKDGNDPGVINQIGVDQNCPPGVVRVNVILNPDDPNEVPDPNAAGALDGAYDLKEINLTNASYSELGDLRIRRYLTDPNFPDGVKAGALTGSLVVYPADENDVGGLIRMPVDLDELSGTIYCRRLYELTVGTAYSTAEVTVLSAVQGPIDITGDLAVLYVGQLAAPVTISGDVEWAYVAALSNTLHIVNGDLEYLGTGTFDPNGVLNVEHGDLGALVAGPIEGNILVGRDLTGYIYVEESGSGMPGYTFRGITGDITIGRDLLGWIHVLESGMQGHLVVHGDFLGEVYLGLSQAGDLKGTITVDGAMEGRIRATGDLVDENGDQGGGHVIVKGPFGLTDQYVGITIDGVMAGDTEYVTIDYDGYDPNDRWGPYGHVVIDGNDYTVNTSDARVYEITECKGDMNNDGAVNFGDIDGFVAAIPYDPEDENDPNHPYNQMYPGLAGSAIFHGDLACPCNNHVGFEDIDPFADRVMNRCCVEECGACPQDGRSRGAEPGEVARVLLTHVANEHQALLFHAVEQAATLLPDRSRRAYWRAVYEAMSQ